MNGLQQREAFDLLDSDVRKLLSLIHSVRIHMVIGDKEKASEDLQKARLLIRRIEEALNGLGD